MREIISGQYQRAQLIISEHRAALDKVAMALIEHETIEGKHVLEILKHGEIQSPVLREAMGKSDAKAMEKRAADKAAAPGALAGVPTPTPTPA